MCLLMNSYLLQPENGNGSGQTWPHVEAGGEVDFFSGGFSQQASGVRLVVFCRRCSRDLVSIYVRTDGGGEAVVAKVQRSSRTVERHSRTLCDAEFKHLRVKEPWNATREPCRWDRTLAPLYSCKNVMLMRTLRRSVDVLNTGMIMT